MNYREFEKQMKALGYQIIKGRGISFVDDKKVKVKGSEVGFSLAKIEKVLELKRQLGQEKQNSQQRQQEQNLQYLRSPEHQDRSHDETEMVELIERQISKLINELIKPEYRTDGVNIELIRKSKKKKRRRHRQMSR